MSAQEPEALVVGVRGKGGARRARFLAPQLRPVGAVDRLGLAPQRRDLVRAEAIGQKEIAVVVERLQLLGREPHGGPPWTGGGRSCHSRGCGSRYPGGGTPLLPLLTARNMPCPA